MQKLRQKDWKVNMGSGRGAGNSGGSENGKSALHIMHGRTPAEQVRLHQFPLFMLSVSRGWGSYPSDTHGLLSPTAILRVICWPSSEPAQCGHCIWEGRQALWTKQAAHEHIPPSQPRHCTADFKSLHAEPSLAFTTLHWKRFLICELQNQYRTLS